MKVTPAEVLTAPNAISAAGFALVADGCRKLDTPAGLAEVTVGRLLDLADGAVARATGQTSDFGAAVDATLDKAGMAAIGVAAWRQQSVPRPLLAAIAAQEIINGTAAAVAQHRYPDAAQRPSRSGKFAMAAKNVGLFGYLAAHALKDSHPRASNIARGIGFTATVFGLGMGLHASSSYIRRAL